MFSILVGQYEKLFPGLFILEQFKYPFPKSFFIGLSAFVRHNRVNNLIFNAHGWVQRIHRDGRSA